MAGRVAVMQGSFRAGTRDVKERMGGRAGALRDPRERARGWLEAEDIRACLLYAHRIVAHERVEPPVVDEAV